MQRGLLRLRPSALNLHRQARNRDHVAVTAEGRRSVNLQFP